VSGVLKRGITVFCAVALALIVLVLLLPAALGLQRYVITGGSMTGAISKGSIVYARLTPVADLRQGDIITFTPPDSSGAVTHRILSIKEESGRRIFETKGDFNAVTDPWKITFPQPEQARYVFHIPYAGYVLALLSLRLVRMLVIGLPALLIGVSLLWSLWVSAGEEARRQETAAPVVESIDRP
jgi:signal peptidase